MRGAVVVVCRDPEFGLGGGQLGPALDAAFEASGEGDVGASLVGEGDDGLWVVEVGAGGAGVVSVVFVEGVFFADGRCEM